MKFLNLAMIISLLSITELMYSMDAAQVLPINNALVRAVERDGAAAVASLIQEGANPDEKLAMGFRPLMIACQEGYLETVKVLVESKKIDLNAQNAGGISALRYAVSKQHTARTKAYYEIIELLLKNGANPDIRDPEDGFTPLMTASLYGDEKMVHLLLAYGADYKLTSKAHVTALMLASTNDHIGIVRALLTAGADENKRNDDGYNAFMYAAAAGKVNILEEYLNRKAPIHLRTKHGQTALMLAAMRDHALLVTMLLHAGANPYSHDMYGNTALNLAEKNRCTRVVEVLEMQQVQHLIPAPHYAAAPAGKTIIEAARDGNEHAVLAALENGAFVDSRGDSNETPLCAAAANGHTSIVKRLIEAGANVHRSATLKKDDKTGRTTNPLQEAIRGRHTECARLLREAGASEQANQ